MVQQDLQTTGTTGNGGNGSLDTKKAEKKVGPIIATLVIVLILLIAALYLFASRITQPIIPDDSPDADTVPTVQPVTSTSTDLHALQNDLNASTNGLGGQNF